MVYSQYTCKNGIFADKFYIDFTWFAGFLDQLSGSFVFFLSLQVVSVSFCGCFRSEWPTFYPVIRGWSIPRCGESYHLCFHHFNHVLIFVRGGEVWRARFKTALCTRGGVTSHHLIAKGSSGREIPRYLREIQVGEVLYFGQLPWA